MMSCEGPRGANRAPAGHTSEIGPAELRNAPLGHPTVHPDHYAPALLYPVPRAPQRAALGIGARLPFSGVDLWTAYELTWLDERGKPQVALATLQVPVDSPAIVESKSMKLYLGSFAQSRYACGADVAATIARDVSHAAGAPVLATLQEPAAFAAQSIAELSGESLDELPIACAAYDVAPDLLSAGGATVAETLTTRLFRSVCPVTAQPDIASIEIAYRGPRIDRAGLLRYVVSYRCHAGFHEHCVERIFADIAARCRCEQLTVYARFLRRGGIDINPFRTNAGSPPPANVRTARQ
jgi:7-cyano-7-deazaguanine reductase